MFFLLRSACCIGMVVAALPDPGTPSGRAKRPAADHAIAATGVEQVCRSSPARCLDLLAEGLRSGAPAAYKALASRVRSEPSRDTLTAADRRPAWAGRVAAAD